MLKFSFSIVIRLKEQIMSHELKIIFFIKKKKKIVLFEFVKVPPSSPSSDGSHLATRIGFLRNKLQTSIE